MPEIDPFCPYDRQYTKIKSRVNLYINENYSSMTIQYK
jgi:hypothetical protein